MPKDRSMPTGKQHNNTESLSMGKWIKYILGTDWVTVSKVRDDQILKDFDAWWQPIDIVIPAFRITQQRNTPWGGMQERSYYSAVK